MKFLLCAGLIGCSYLLTACQSSTGNGATTPGGTPPDPKPSGVFVARQADVIVPSCTKARPSTFDARLNPGASRRTISTFSLDGGGFIQIDELATITSLSPTRQELTSSHKIQLNPGRSGSMVRKCKLEDVDANCEATELTFTRDEIDAIRIRDCHVSSPDLIKSKTELGHYTYPNGPTIEAWRVTDTIRGGIYCSPGRQEIGPGTMTIIAIRTATLPSFSEGTCGPEQIFYYSEVLDKNGNRTSAYRTEVVSTSVFE